ncbi:hypothetical protein TNCV_4248601 [Trichonephila clavipes]|nr:hypothetical protein TNCV_4248601 [Trichonephila clavipes]
MPAPVIKTPAAALHPNSSLASRYHFHESLAFAKEEVFLNRILLYLSLCAWNSNLSWSKDNTGVGVADFDNSALTLSA